MSQQKAVHEILLRSYPKIIFLWPTLLCSFSIWIIGMIMSMVSPTGELDPTVSVILAWIWVIIFASNLFVMAFDFQSTKFFVLILAIVAVALILVIVYLMGGFEGLGGAQLPSFNISMSVEFYFATTILIFVILGIIWLSRRVDYYRIERNEIYHRNGFLGKAERIPTSSLTFEKEIPDVFEYILLRAGSITIHPSRGKTINLTTVPNIKKIEKNLDQLLSRITVEVDDTDKTPV